MSPRLVLAALAAVALATPVRADGYLRYLPANSRAVFVFNLKALPDDQRKTGDDFVRQLYTTQLAPELKKLDKLPVTDLEQVVVAQPYLGSVNLVNLVPAGAAALVLLRGKVDADLLDKQLREAAKQSNDALKIESLGKPAAAVYSRKVDDKALTKLLPVLEQVPAEVRPFAVPPTTHVVALDSQTLAVSFMGRPALERALRARPVKTKPRVGAAMVKLLEGLDDKDAASMVLVKRDDEILYPGLQFLAPKEVLDWFAPLKTAAAAMRLDKGLKLKMTAACRPEDAEKLEKATTKAAKAASDALPEGMKKGREAAKTLLASLKTSRKDGVVTIEASLTEDDLKKLLPDKK